MIARITALIVLMSLTWQPSVTAQIDYDVYPDVTSTYMINDVHIQKSPKDSFGLGDILIKDGFIVQVSREIQAPVDAYVIEGDSAYVYPAFIDPISHTGIAKKEGKEDRPKVKFQGHPPNGVVGITPEVQAHTLVEASGEAIKSMKANGYAISNVVPRGTMLPGQGSLMLLEGDSNEDMVLSESTCMYMQFKGTRGFYPTTIIGVMAKWRDLYRQSGYLDEHMSKTKNTASPLKRAKTDKSLASLIPLTKKQQTLFMRAEKAKDIHRAIALKKELGYNLVLAEVKQAGPTLEKIKAERIPVLISAKLPKEEKDKKGKDGGKKGKDKGDKMMEKGKEMKDMDMKKEKKKMKEKKEDDPETKALKARKKKSFEEYIGQAAMLEKEGIEFGISLLDSKPGDIKKSLTRMMKAGLSQEAALAALTTNPAKLLGISDKVGTIDNGKMANLFLSDAPYWNESSIIKYIFVEGEMTEFEVKKKKKSSGETSAEFLSSILGKWSYEVETPMGTFDGTITISGKDDLKVVITGSDDPDNPMEGREVTADEPTLSYVMDIDMGATSIPATTEMTIDGDSFSGTVNMEGMGSMAITGTKTSGPE